jgi:hypothetical protein
MRLVLLEIPPSHRSKLLAVDDHFTTCCGSDLANLFVRNLSIWLSLANGPFETAEEYAFRAV